MPDYILTYTATMPGSQAQPEKFRIKITADNPVEANVKLHRFVQKKVQTTLLGCVPVDSTKSTAFELEEVLTDLKEAVDMYSRLGDFRKKYGLDEAKK